MKKQSLIFLYTLAQREADQCAQANQRLLDAQTEEEINTAAMVMNILCEA